jgi:hypothetical protein
MRELACDSGRKALSAVVRAPALPEEKADTVTFERDFRRIA